MSQTISMKTERCTLYEILQVPEDASAEEIKKFYRRAVLIHHPDKGGNGAMFKQVVDAYHILADPTRRKLYDDMQRGTSGNRSSVKGINRNQTPTEMKDTVGSGSSVKIINRNQKSTERKDFSSSGSSINDSNGRQKHLERNDFTVDQKKNGTKGGRIYFRADMLDGFFSDHELTTQKIRKYDTHFIANNSKMKKIVYDSKTVKDFEKVFFTHFQRA
ncbi:hypothetical protein R1flu_003450 [Riccia fluitans]|uniref:J domain-containing protein n=1 Tax=Riccia fluitans TaxID=41844 RepID=A0ABD1Y964_9MARC